MGTADLHIHTTGSDGMGTAQQVLDYAERFTSLSVIAVTDHDDLTPALRAADLHARNGGYRFDLITGIEVTTIEGHLLALFVGRHVPSFRSLPSTLAAIHEQGGLAIIPHPMSPLTRSIGRHGIERVLRWRAEGVWFDGIELANQSPAGRWTARRARVLNDSVFHLAAVGGSDAHYLPVIGASFTEFAGRSAAELHAAIINHTTDGCLGRQPTLREIGARQILLQTARGLWATPSKVIGGRGRRLLRSAMPAAAKDHSK